VVTTSCCDAFDKIPYAPIDRSLTDLYISQAVRTIFGRSLGVFVLGVGSATAQQSTRSPCAPAWCIHTPHVWSPTRERETRRCPAILPRAPSPAGPPACACRTACERCEPSREYIERVPVSSLRPPSPFSLSFSPPPLSLSLSLTL